MWDVRVHVHGHACIHDMSRSMSMISRFLCSCSLLCRVQENVYKHVNALMCKLRTISYVVRDYYLQCRHLLSADSCCVHSVPCVHCAVYTTDHFHVSIIHTALLVISYFIFLIVSQRFLNTFMRMSL
jgi:hypothetical protein